MSHAKITGAEPGGPPPRSTATTLTESLREPAKEHVQRCHAMALDQSALLEVLDALKVADVGYRVRSAA